MKKNNPVISVGDIELNEYMFNRRLARYKETYTNSYGYALNNIAFAKWKEELIKDLYFAMESKTLKLDTSENFKYRMKMAEKHQVMKYGGLYWKNKVEPRITPDENEIEQCYSLRNKVYYLKIISFHGKEERNNYLGKDIIFSSSKLFNNYFIKILGENPYLAAEMNIQYPFANLPQIKDTLPKVKTGEVIGPIISNHDLIYLLIERVDTVNLKPLVTEKEVIINELKNISDYSLWNQIKNNIVNRSKVQVIKNNALSALNIIHESGSSIMKLLEKDYYETVIAYFFVNDIENLFTFKDLYYFLKSKPINRYPLNETEMVNIINEYALQENMYAEAEELGLTNDMNFNFEKTDYRIKLLTKAYKDEILNRISFNNDELDSLYNADKLNFKFPVESSFTVLSFKNIQAAMECIKTLANILNAKQYELLENEGLFPGIQKIESGLIVNNSFKGIKEKDIDNVLSLKPDNFYKPVLYQNNYSIYIKEADLKYKQQSKDEVSNVLIEKIIHDKYKKELEKTYNHLKCKYETKTYKKIEKIYQN